MSKEFAGRAEELKGLGLEPEEEGNISEKFLKSLESLKIMVPEPVEIDVPGSGQKIKVVELAVKKHLEVEKMMNELHISTTEKFKDYKNLSFDQLFNLRLEDWKTIRPLIMAICDNGMNPFVTEEFCDNYISQSLAMNIIYTYIMKILYPGLHPEDADAKFFRVGSRAVRHEQPEDWFGQCFITLGEKFGKTPQQLVEELTVVQFFWLMRKLSQNAIEFEEDTDPSRGKEKDLEEIPGIQFE